MAGRRARRRPRQRGWSAAVAAITLALVSIAYLGGMWPAPTSVDVFLSIPPPPQFWFVLLLVVAQVVIASLYIRERGRLRQALSGGAPALQHSEPELRPHAPMAGEAPEPEEVVYEEAASPAVAAVPAPETKRDGELSKLLQWLDDISTQISGWANDVMESADSAVRAKEAAGSTPLALEDAKPRGTSKIPVPKLGAWSEVRARTAIEKYLRRRPWAPAADIAKDLGMDLRLASRVTSSVREESVR